jgi:hypothetical protein
MRALARHSVTAEGFRPSDRYRASTVFVSNRLLLMHQVPFRGSKGYTMMPRGYTHAPTDDVPKLAQQDQFELVRTS